jgi:hypothetical protein
MSYKDFSFFTPWSEVAKALHGLHHKLDLILKNQEAIMATLDDDLAAATAEGTKIDSLLVIMQGMVDRIKAIPGLTPAQQTQIDAIGAAVTNNEAKVQAAIDANTPAQPAGPVVKAP